MRAASDAAPSTTDTSRRSPRFAEAIEAPARGLGVPGLDAVDVGVDPQQPVAVRLRDVVVAVLLERIQPVVLGKVADQRRGETAEVVRRRVVLRVGQPRRVGEARVDEAEPLRLRVHPLGECRLAAGDHFGQRDRGVVAGLHDHAVQEFVDRHRAPHLDEHPRALGPPRALRHRDRLRRRQYLVAQRDEHKVRGHQLGQRCRVPALVGVVCGQRRAAGVVEQQPRRRGHRRLRLRDDERAGKQRRQQSDKGREAEHQRGTARQSAIIRRSGEVAGGPWRRRTRAGVPARRRTGQP